jgi:hypothetical protein
MATLTQFLQMILPANGEYPGSWGTVLDNDLQAVDAFLSVLRSRLDGGTASDTTYGSLVGSAASLAARLNVSINPDGTLNIADTPDVVVLATSIVNGFLATPSARFALTDREIFDARARALGNRYDPTVATPGVLDDGLALRSARYNGVAVGYDDAAAGVQTPIRSFAAGTVVGGPANCVTTPGDGTVTIAGGSQAVLINIDGYPFRVRYNVVLDVGGAPAPPAPGQVIYIFAERRDYADANYLYRRFGAVVSTSADLRVVQSGTDGASSGTTFTAGTGLFVTRGVQIGDILTITGGTNAGDYVVSSVGSDGTLSTFSPFPTNVTAMSWSISDEMSPSIGFLAAAAGTNPPYQAGRTYLAEATFGAGPTLTNLLAYAKNGISQTVLTGIAAGSSFPVTVNHNLGALPSSVEVFASATGLPNGVEYPPQAKHDPGNGMLIRIPTILTRTSRTQAFLTMVDPEVAKRLYTDESGTDVLAGALRIVVRR